MRDARLNPYKDLTTNFNRLIQLSMGLLIINTRTQTVYISRIDDEAAMSQKKKREMLTNAIEALVKNSF